MSRPPILIPHAPGTNRDHEAALAVEQAGGDPRIVHMNALRSASPSLLDHAAVLLPGGFSYGDALGAGARMALELRTWFADELAAMVASGRPVLGICNGFQALVRAGLIDGRVALAGNGQRQVTLTNNARGRFECRWVTLRCELACRSTWLTPLLGSLMRCPVAHGEGRIALRASATGADLDANGLIAFRYVRGAGGDEVDGVGGDEVHVASGDYPHNPNGSADDIAGMCDATGMAVGLMPHPEDHIVDWQRPSGPPGRRGLALFEALVAAAR